MEWSNTHPDTGINVKTVSWLPPEASNISYYKTYSWTAYEFDMDEESFKKWAGRWKIKPICGEEKIPRYLYYWKTCERRNSEKDFAFVQNGLYDFYQKNSGGAYRVIYDRDKHRVYYQSNPR